MSKVEFIEREIGDRSSLHESNLVKKKKYFVYNKRGLIIGYAYESYLRANNWRIQLDSCSQEKKNKLRTDISSP